MTHGQVELPDLVLALAKNIPALEGVSVWTYSLARTPKDGAGFLALPAETMRVILNYGQQEHRKKSLGLWLELCPHLDIRVTRTHAKIARVWGGGKKYLVHGSGNASKTTQLVEQWHLLLAGNEEFWAVLESAEAELPAWGCTGREAHAASGVGRTAVRRAVAKKLGLKSLVLEKK